MIRITENSIVYVVCPAYNKTGGTELAHQLVYEMYQQGVNVLITYYGDGEEKINPAFKIYVSEYADLNEVEDNAKNVIIFPEIRQDLVDSFSNIQKCVWWMSVDNYLKRNGIKGCYQFYGFLRMVRHLLLGHIKVGGQRIKKDIMHFYQSEYAHQFLMSHGVAESYRLSDFINQSYLEDEPDYKLERENNVLYNPKKGIEFTKKLMQESPQFNWVPIENMTTEEVRALLRESKVYIDFGNHPGKDRFPREAAISGCCVITGKRGSAAYYEDIPISEEFKFEDIDRNIDAIINRIDECIVNYEIETQKFEGYRDFIRKEYSVFKQAIANIIGRK